LGVNSLRVRLPQVLKQHQPDVLGVQEAKVSDTEFLSKLPAKDCVADPPRLTDIQRRILMTFA
jgi:exonuclease III